MRSAAACLTLTLLGISPISAFAHGNEPHAEGAVHETEAVSLLDAKATWQAASGFGQQIETATKANDFAALHDLTEKLTASLQLLKSVTAEMPEQRRIRLQGAISQSISATGDLHQAADKNDVNLTMEKQARLQSALKLIEKIGGNFLIE